nr:DUF4238 domain-containing protein [Candidatus Sigynarchaeota archaeon]
MKKNSIPRKEHYVPVFYLNFFGRSAGAKSFVVSVYDKVRRIPIDNVNTKKICCEKDFYDLDGKNEAKINKSIDAHYARYLSEIIERGSINNLTFEERTFISDWMVRQLVRTKIIRDRLVERLKIIEKANLKELPPLDDESYKTLAINNQLKLLSHHDIKMIDSIRYGTWLLLKNESDELFYTCDNPVMKFTDFRPSILYKMLVDEERLTWIYLVSPRLCLVAISLGESLNKFIQLNITTNLDGTKRDTVQFLNSLVIRNAGRWIISQSADFSFAHSYLAELDRKGRQPKPYFEIEENKQKIEAFIQKLKEKEKLLS